MVKPIITWPATLNAHRARHIQLLEYGTDGRGRKKVSTESLQRLLGASASSLFATNTDARLALTLALCGTWRSGSFPPGYFFVTLAPIRFSVPLEQRPPFEVREIISWAKNALIGFQYVGMIDFALYTNLPFRPRQRVVSWHTHAVVWGCSEAEIDQAVFGVNKRHLTLVPGMTAAHARRLTAGQVEGRLIYMAKAPLKEYRVYKSSNSNDLDGPLDKGTRRFHQHQRNLRPGDALRLHHILGSYKLPELAFGSRDGQSFLSTALSRARQILAQTGEANY